MIAIDASVWVSALLPDDPHHEASIRLLEELLDSEASAVAPSLALCEVASAVARRTGRPALAREAIHEIARLAFLRLVDLDEALAREAAEIAAARKLRGADSVYVAVARRLGFPLVTWDRDQAARSRGLVAAGPPAA